MYACTWVTPKPWSATSCDAARARRASQLRLRVHLPLKVPAGSSDACALRVADEARQWEVGRALIFDDAFEHEVWNETDESRVVLLFDLWHPDLSGDEIAAIQAMFAEVEAMRAARNAG
mgnify:CR=1 FL=1